MKIGVISLGCDKNRVDTEKMLARLSLANYEIVNSEEEADIIIINTCAFIDSAKSESIEEILTAIEYKKLSKDKKIIVTGCLSQRYLDSLKDDLSEVDAYLGVCNYDDIISTINTITKDKKVRKIDKIDKFISDRVLTTPYHYAYLKIADGCNNHCTYCAIPSIRGKYVSEKIEDLMEEAKKLSDDGVKELILVAQDVTRYGIDFDGKSHIIELLDQLSKLDFEWIRLLYNEPEMVTDEFLDYVKSNNKVVNYLDIPLQHVDTQLLKVMGRHTNYESSLELIKKCKEKGIKVRTTFITGFPGETDEKFNLLKEFVKEQKLDYAGFFAYSKEEGTPAYKLKGQISKKIKEQRVKELKEIQTKVIIDNNNKYIGKTIKVIYDGIDYDRQLFIGRSEFQTPDIDNLIYFKSEKKVEIGQFYDVKIEKLDGIDLIGSVL